MKTKRLTYYQRVLKPRIDAGRCYIKRCGQPVISSGLCLSCYKKYNPNKTPNGQVATPWAKVDWSLTNKEIAFHVNRSDSAVCTARKKWAKPCPTCGCKNPRRALPTIKKS